MFSNKASIIMSVAAASVVMTTGIGYAAEQGVVTADSLNIRSGPSTSYSIKAKVTKGTVVILGNKNSNGWYEVTLPNGVTGWASGHYIDVIKNESSQQGEITEATYLRKEAKWTTDKLALLEKGVKVDVISVDTNWTKVKYNGEIGYIANQCIKVTFLQKDENEKVEETTPQESSKGKITVATYLRKEAKWTTDKLALLNVGTEFEIISKGSNWTKVKYDGMVGYVGNDYFEIIKNAISTPEKPQVPETEEVLKMGEIITCDTYLRKSASWSAEKLYVLTEGTKVEIISSDSNWTKVKHGDQVGYIGNNYIKEIEEVKEEVKEELQENQGKILDATYLRDADNWSANKIVVLEANTIVEVIERGSSWTKVKYGEYEGYISNSYIEVAKTPDTDTNTDKEGKISEVINLAKMQLGKPYEWGAEGPNSFDCSGLMYYVFKNGADITLPRSSKEQAKAGREVSYSDMKPGDIISFDFDKDGVVSHVGMYIGDDQFIHARKPGTFVETTSITMKYWNDSIYNIRRVIE